MNRKRLFTSRQEVPLNICVIVDEERKANQLIIKDLKQLLSKKCNFMTLNVPVLPDSRAFSQDEPDSLAHIYLLKSHMPRALEVARQLEARGACVINSWAATLACQDRVQMFGRMKAAQIPVPDTWSLDRFAYGLNADLLSSLPFPVVVKNRYAYESCSVDKVENVETFMRLAHYWSAEPVVVQQYVANDGWDTKIWVIDGHLFAAKRRSPLNAGEQDQFQLAPEELGGDAKRIALEVGKIFGLHIYDVDLLMSEQGPIVIDVNPFPGFRGLFGPEETLAAFIERRLNSDF
ncbi:MAG TPA: hypothetical protein VKV37_00355 [Ktedonobacteraceae bacterium]|nr:hypothetical protein [Ktedonobacteraceae bacterium]